MTGTVVKGIGGFYYVYDGSSVVMGKARGILKRNKELIYVGDIVDFDIDDNDMDGDCVINSVIERKNYLTRPPVSNLDTLVVVFSLVQPDANFPVIDKLIAGCEMKGIDPIICISKTDLANPESVKNVSDMYADVYAVVCINGMTGEGVSDLIGLISSKRAALAGPSGVGKSTITNHILSSFNEIYVEYEDIEQIAKTGGVSSKTGRGRHTTRHVEIFPLPDGTMLYDTPGFTSLDMTGLEPKDVGNLFPEIRRASGECKYADCIHVNEPGCAVKQALDNRSIALSRYNSYVAITEEVNKWKR